MTKYSIEKINTLAVSDTEAFVRKCSDDYIASVHKAGDRFLSEGKKIIMLAGPSSSGKTTTALILAEYLTGKGCAATTVSLDDFYLARSQDYPLNPDGTPDYETVDSLDLPLIHSCFENLVETGEGQLPIFDFKTHSRSTEVRNVTLGKDEIIIVEGIHGLNPRITDNLPDDKMAKLYVSVSSRLFNNDDKLVLNKRNLRLIRRLVRDYRFRNTGTCETFSIWESVMAGEEKYIFPFRNFADIKLDSFHPCEPGLLASEAKSLLKDAEGTVHEEKAHELAQAISQIAEIDRKYLVGDSLLYEFLGKN